MKKKDNLGVVMYHNNKKGEIHKGDPRKCDECKQYFINYDNLLKKKEGEK